MPGPVRLRRARSPRRLRRRAAGRRATWWTPSSRSGNRAEVGTRSQASGWYVRQTRRPFPRRGAASFFVGRAGRWRAGLDLSSWLAVERVSSRRSTRLAVALMALPLVAGGCVGPGFFTDFSSVSLGTFNQGLLRHGRRLPSDGEGYVVPPLWARRGNQFATDELVAAIRRAARRVKREYPGSTLGIGDLSQRGGGDSELHRSHENGRDADLIYFAVDDKGKPVRPADSMPRYGTDLKSMAPVVTHNVTFGPFTPRRFDVKRNW